MSKLWSIAAGAMSLSVLPMCEGGGLIDDDFRFDYGSDNEDEAPRPEQQTVDSSRFHYGPLLQLNRNTFDGNVLRESADRVGEWMVFACPRWWEPCQQWLQPFTDVALQWQLKLNANSLLKLQVRFAFVDCAIEKPLCNTMEVTDYPTIQHYRNGERLRNFVPGKHDTGKEIKKLEWLMGRWLHKTSDAEVACQGAANIKVWHEKETVAGAPKKKASGFVQRVAACVHATLVALMGRPIEPSDGAVGLAILTISFIATLHTAISPQGEQAPQEPSNTLVPPGENQCRRRTIEL